MPELPLGIMDARWTPRVNVLTVLCGCGQRFDHRADRRRVSCACGNGSDLHRIRATDDYTARPLRTAALRYASLGWHVFPLVPGGKRPAITDWETRASATDTARIERCWRTAPYGVGIACGPSGLVVVDLDLPKPGDGPLPAEWQAEGVTDGMDVLAVLADRAGAPLPIATYVVRTGRGGVHLYFRHPPGGEALRNTQGSSGGLGPMVDSRAHGGYVVAPPTAVAGRSYRVVTDVAPAALPGWLAVALKPAPLPAQEPVSIALPANRSGAYLRAALDAELARVRTSPPDGHNTAVYRAAVALGQLVAGGVLGHDQVVGVLTAAAIYVGQDPREAARTIASGLRAGARRPRTVAA